MCTVFLVFKSMILLIQIYTLINSLKFQENKKFFYSSSKDNLSKPKVLVEDLASLFSLFLEFLWDLGSSTKAPFFDQSKEVGEAVFGFDCSLCLLEPFNAQSMDAAEGPSCLGSLMF